MALFRIVPKTVDFIVDTNFNEDTVINGGSYNAIYFKDKSYSQAISGFSVEGDDLVILTKINDAKITVKNYFLQNGKHPIKTIKTDEPEGTVSLNIIDEGLISNPSTILHPQKTTITTGSAFNDTVDLSSYEVPEGTKTLSINTDTGNDSVTGSSINDIINTGAGDDIIYSSKGNDTITGGAGTNRIVYSGYDFGTDTVNLTSGENLTIDLSSYGFETLPEVFEKIKIEGRNLVIDLGDNAKINFTNFVTANAVGANGDVKIDIGNTSFSLNKSKYLTLNETYIDAKGNITGSRLSENININDADTALNVNTGAGYDSVNITGGGAFADKITGAGNESKFINIVRDGDKAVTTGAGNDEISISGNGNKTVTAGNGNNIVSLSGNGTNKITTGLNDDKIILSGGTNTVISGKGNDEFHFVPGNGTYVLNDADTADAIYIDDSSVTLEDIKFFKNGNNLEIRVEKGDKSDSIIVTGYITSKTRIKDFYLTNNSGNPVKQDSVDDIIKNRGGFLLSGRGMITGTNEHETIYGSEIADKINAGGGDDIIYASKGNDIITGGIGENKVIYNTIDFDDDTINLTKGEKLKIDFSQAGITKNDLAISLDGKNGKDVLLSVQNGGTVRLSNFGSTDLVGDTGEVKIITSTGEINLKDYVYDVTLGVSNTLAGRYTGTYRNENINASGYSSGVTVNSGAGDDIITGSTYNDNITGGIGSNIIIVKNEIFGNDTINYTLNEKLTLDLSAYNYNGAADFNGKINLTAKGLEINIPEKGRIILNNYTAKQALANKNIETSDVNILLKGNTTLSLGGILSTIFSEAEILFDANGNYTGSAGADDIDASPLNKNTNINVMGGYNKVKGTNGYNDVISGGNDGNEITAGSGNKTVTTGTGDDKISIIGDGNKIVSAGNGDNEITLSGDGRNTITTGLNNDKIFLSGGVNTVMTGKGNDEIHITPSGASYTLTDIDANDAVYIDDKNVNANNVVLYKSADNLEIRVTKGDLTDSIVVNGYFKSKSKIEKIYFRNNSNGYDETTIDEIKVNQNGYYLSGKGIITGTNEDESIYGSELADRITANGGNDKIYAGDGNDIINTGTGINVIEGGKGDDTINIDSKATSTRINYYMATGNAFQNNGHDVIVGATSKDTVYFDIGSRSFDTSFRKSANDLVVYFEAGENSGSVTLKNYFTQNPADRLDNIIVHTLIADDEFSYGDNEISLRQKIQEYGGVDITGSGMINGSNENDKIYGSKASDTINALGGDDVIYASEGNDKITGGTGNNTVVYAIDGNIGNDVINYTVGEKLTIDFSYYNFNINTLQKEDITLLPSGVRLNLGYNNFITINNYTAKQAITNKSLENCDVKIKLNNSTTMSLGSILNKFYTDNDILFDARGNYAGYDTDENIDASSLAMNTNINVKGGYNKVKGTNGYNDVISGGNDGNEITAGSGNKTVTTGTGDDKISIIGDGNKIVNAGNGKNIITLSGNGTNTVQTGIDNDRINLSGGVNTITTGTGRDGIFITPSNGTYIIADANPSDEIYIDDNTVTLDNIKFFKAGNNLEIRIETENTRDSIIVNGYINSTAPITDLYLKNNDGEYVKQKSISEIIIENGGFKVGGSGTITGSNAPESIYGSDIADKITAGDGDDVIYAYGGNDTIFAGDGNDTVYAGDGNDFIYSGTGSNVIEGGKGDDTINIDSKSTSNQINYYLAKENEFQNNGHDVIIGATNKDSLYIDVDNIEFDVSFRKSTNDLVIYFDAGENNGSITLKNYYTQNQADRLDKVIVHSLVHDNPLFAYGERQYYLQGLIEQHGGLDITGAGSIQGSEDTDKIFGSNSNDTINALGGNDVIYGYDGNDTINGGDGNDTIVGGKGNDTLSGGKGKDWFVYQIGDGTDTLPDADSEDVLNFTDAKSSDLLFNKNGNNLEIVYSPTDKVIIPGYFTSTNKVDKILAINPLGKVQSYLISDRKINITGSGLINGSNENDIIIGSDKIDTIKALDGDDIIYGTGGNDNITGGNGINTIIYNSQFGNDTINLTNGETLNLDFTALPGINKDNITVGFSGVNNKDVKIATEYGTLTLNNYGNTDVLGEDGNVSIKFADNSTVNMKDCVYDATVTSAIYNGNFHNERIDASASKVAVTINAKDGNDTVIGSNFNDKINTGSGINVIDGGKGNDTITIDPNATSTRINYYMATGNAFQKNGHDTVIGATSKDTLYIDIGECEFETNFRRTINDLTIYFDAGENSGSVTLKDYFSQNEADRLDNLIVHNLVRDDDEFAYGDNEISLSGKIAEYGGLYIFGSDGNDTIYATGGNDTISCGKGNDSIIYNLPNFGNDNINLTEGETLVLDFSQSGLSYYDMDFSLTGENNKDVKISTTKGTVTINDFGASNVTGAKGKVIIKTATKELNLHDDVIYSAEMQGNSYNGNWHHETINARSKTQPVTINGGGGDDNIYGGKGNDIINGDSGDDVITGGKGNDTLTGGSGFNTYVFNSGDGTDTVTDAKIWDELCFENIYIENLSFGLNNNDLVINYGTNDNVIISDYLNSTSPIDNILISNNKEEKYYYISDLTDICPYEPEVKPEKKYTLQPSASFRVGSVNTVNSSGLIYLVENLSSQSNEFTFHTLDNGRLLIKGNNLSITAVQNQNDDIILIGNNNYVDTNYGNDIVRLGFVNDSDYVSACYNNYVDTGDGNDHIAIYGSGNQINMGNGSKDSVFFYNNYSANTVYDAEYFMQYGSLTADTKDLSAGFFAQAAYPDCRLFSALNSIELSPYITLSRCVNITSNSNGLYTVTFNNYTGGQNTVSNIDAMSVFKSNYNSFGDLDIFLIDHAMNVLLQTNRDRGKNAVYNAYENTISKYLFGTEATTYVTKRTTGENSKSCFKELYTAYKRGQIKSLIVGLLGIEDESLGYLTGHAYSISDMTDKCLTLINPWDNQDRVMLSLTEFDNELVNYDRNLYITAIGYGTDYFNQNKLIANGGRIYPLAGSGSIDAIVEQTASWLADSSTDIAAGVPETSVQDDIAALTTAVLPEEYLQQT